MATIRYPHPALPSRSSQPLRRQIIWLRQMFAGSPQTLPMGRLSGDPAHPCASREAVAMAAPKGRSHAPLAPWRTLAHTPEKGRIAPRGRNTVLSLPVRSLPSCGAFDGSKERLCLYVCGLRPIRPSKGRLGRGHPCTPLARTSARLRHVASSQAHGARP